MFLLLDNILICVLQVLRCVQIDRAVEVDDSKFPRLIVHV